MRKGLFIRRINRVQYYHNCQEVSEMQFMVVDSSGSESDLKYLTDLILTVKGKGAYVGAYRNYEDLIEAFKEYSNAKITRNTLKLKLKLNLNLTLD